MLIHREALDFDFKGAAFDLKRAGDLELLGWIFNQFLYGEVTGIQCGHWLYHAPSLTAAQFLAKQAGEELSHVRKILRILSLLGEKPAPAHPVIRFLSTSLMGGSWGEHVVLEMALGEGLVLGVFYAMARTIPDPEIHRILEQALGEEERHVEFGERETREWLERNPRDRKLLFTLALIQVVALKRLKNFVLRRLRTGANAAHPVLSQFEAFYDHTLSMFELRIDRLGLSAQPLSRLTALEKLWLVATLPARKLVAFFSRKLSKGRLLTSTYLLDPLLLAERERSHPGSDPAR